MSSSSFANQTSPPFQYDPSNPPYEYSYQMTVSFWKLIGKIYDVKFCPYFEDVFATVSEAQVSIYQYIHKDEQYYAVDWVSLKLCNVLNVFLVVGGKRGIIRTVDPFVKKNTVCTLFGHGDAINCIARNPNVESTFVSASKDHSIRLWHCMKKLALRFFMEMRIKLYLLTFIHLVILLFLDLWIILSELHIIHNADALSRDHLGYVDCVKFIGSYILSKSTKSFMYLSKFGQFSDPSPCGIGNENPKGFESFSQRIAKLVIPSCTDWFYRFGVHTNEFDSWAACGNNKKVVSIWNIGSRPIPLNSHYEISHPHFPRLVRKVEFNADGNIMLVVGSDGIICRCNKKSNFGKFQAPSD
uniref:Uncharacterized protein n=1 Tax=Panagrolaimus superbus TaxID=310955 RepID=A0A914Y701_9BILA